MDKNRKGFTLIELLVVVAVISLLSSIVFASLNTARAKARDARRMSDIEQIRNAIELYINDNGHAPEVGGVTDRMGWGALTSALTPKYIKTLPKDPCGTTCGIASIYGYSSPSLANPGYASGYGLEATLESKEGSFIIGNTGGLNVFYSF